MRVARCDALKVSRMIVWFSVKNVLRNTRRSTFVVLALAFGTTAIVFADSFVAWILWATRETTIHSQVGHLQVTRAGFVTRGQPGSRNWLLPDSNELRRRIAGHPHVRAVAPRLEFGGLVSGRKTTLSFVGEGVDPEQERAIHALSPLPGAMNIISGRDLTTGVELGGTLGEGLATQIGALPGDKLVLLSTVGGGGLNAVEVEMVGAFQTISKAYDDSALRLPLDVAKKLTRATDVHRLVVVLESTALTDPVVKALRAELKGLPIDVTPWYELADFYNKTETLFTRQTLVVRLILVFVIVLGVSNVLLVAVAERTAEIGTTMTLGATRRLVLARFIVEALLLGILGAAVGLAIALAAAYVVSVVGIPMPPPPGQTWGYDAALLVTPQILVRAFAITVMTAIIAGIVPAWHAARLQIVDALRAGR